MILVVGGCGYVGSHANKDLSGQGYRTVVYDNLSRGHRDLARWGELVVGDLADSGRLRDLFRTHPIEAVMHFSALAYVGESVQDPQSYYLNNVAGTLNLLQIMQEAGVNTLVFSSTCAVYGHPQRVPIPEEHPRDPVSPYGRSKLAVEMILEDYAAAYGLRYAALRYFNAAGADPEAEIGERHNPETHLIPLALAAAAGGPSLTIFGTDYPTADGTCIRDYIHVSDLAAAHLQALRYLQAGGDSCALNLGNGLGYSVRQVIGAVEEVTGRKVRAVEGPRRPGDPPALVGDYRRAATVLGWQPRHSSLETIVRTAWRWHCSDGGA